MILNYKKLSYLLIFNFFTLLAFSQKGEIRGTVQDKETGEPVIGALVFLQGTNMGGSVDVNGFFTINKIDYGKYTLVVTYLGYDTTKLVIDLQSKVVSKNIFLKENTTVFDEFVVSAEQQDKQNQVRTAQTTIDQKLMNAVVSVGGEPDLAQTLQIIPGAITTGDQGGQLYIRGGSPVMNKVLLDGVTIYNPFHSIGLFSVFESDIIRTANVYSAGFGAQYGGRVSAVVDVATREGNKQKFVGKIALNPFNAKILLEGPFKKFTEGGGSSSYILSYKTSYLDKTSKIFYPYANDLPFSFDDLYGKVSFNSNSGSKFELFAFDQVDRVNYSNNTNLKWNATGGGVKFLAIPSSSKTLFEGFAGYSRYQISLNEQDNLPRTSSIGGANVGLNFTYLMGKSDIKYGVEINTFATDFNTVNSAGRNISQDDNNTELSFYTRYRKVTDRMVIEPGMRIQYYASLSEFSPEPRLNLKYKASTRLRFTAAAGIYSQNLMSASSDRDVVNLFYGFLASPEELPKQYRGNNVNSALQKARHYLVGTEFDLTEKINILLEGYIKDFNQITNINRDKIYDNTPAYADKPEYLKTSFIVEQGKASGIDLRLTWEHKNLYIYGVYSYTYITRTDEIRTYFPVFDRRHNINFVTSYDWGKKHKWQFNARFNFGSGFPLTQNQGFYELLDLNGGIGQDYQSANGEIGILYGDIGKGRLPVFNRLDISLKKTYTFSKNSELNIIASVVNVYDRHNIFYFDRVNFIRINQLPILPSLGFNYSF